MHCPFFKNFLDIRYSIVYFNMNLVLDGFKVMIHLIIKLRALKFNVFSTSRDLNGSKRHPQIVEHKN